jgi:TPR repeat protein
MILRMTGCGKIAAALFLAGALLAQAAVIWAQKVPLEQLRQRAAQGDMEAQYWLCYHYWKGEGGEPDYKAAAPYCRKAAQAGHPKAVAVLGSMSRRGQGVARDYRAALRLLGMAANAGVPRADYELGLMYKKGEGVLPDATQADMHFCSAAKQGERLARMECSETKTRMGAFQMGGFTQGLSSSGGFGGLKGRGGISGGAEGLGEDMLRPDMGGVVQPGGPAPFPPGPGGPGMGADLARQNMAQMLQQMAAAQTGGPKPAAPAPASAQGEDEVSLNKAVSLQGSAPQATGLSPKPAVSGIPLPAAAPALVTPLVGGAQPRRTNPWPFIIGGLLCSGLGFAAYFVLKTSLSSSQRRLPETIRGLLASDPAAHQQIADAFSLFCRQGGKTDAFSSQELHAIISSVDAAGRELSLPGLALGPALELAGKLAAEGKMARMQDVLSEPLLVEAAGSGRANDVLVLLAKSKTLDDFAAHFSAPGRSPEFYSAYASGLARLGKTEQSFKMLTAKPMERFSPEDRTLLLELHVKLGHFDQAGLLLGQVSESKPTDSSKDYYEELAKQATMLGGERLAEDLRTIAAGKPLQGVPAKPPVPSGKVLANKYELRKLISTGGMGEVYEGYDRNLDRVVAIKRLLPGLLVDPMMREQFLREAKTAAHLTHPYIVPIYESLVSGDDLYLVFEFVKGETLHSVLARRSRLALKECQGLFHYVCHALDYAHRKHVLHRDLKPANIMLDENGIARVMDFGIAVEATGTLSATFVDQRGVTGTLRYMPPEQHYGKATRASDIYALGVCLYEMSTGYLPFNAPSVPEMVEQKHKGQFPMPSSHVHELPQEFDAFIRQVLAPDPKTRMQTALEFYESLTKIPA